MTIGSEFYFFFLLIAEKLKTKEKIMQHLNIVFSWLDCRSDAPELMLSNMTWKVQREAIA